jgi:WD40 repeat protein
MTPRSVAVFNLLLFSAFLVVVKPAEAQDKGAAAVRDRYGDPLPPAAIARLGTTRLRHTRGWRLEDAAFSPDGKVLASLGGDSRLRLWDTADGKELQSTRLESLSLLSPAVAFSGDGKLLAVGGYYRGVVQVYEVATGKEIARFQAHQGPVTLTFSDDGATLLTGSDDTTILVWDLRSKALLPR